MGGFLQGSSSHGPQDSARRLRKGGSKYQEDGEVKERGQCWEAGMMEGRVHRLRTYEGQF